MNKEILSIVGRIMVVIAIIVLSIDIKDLTKELAEQRELNEGYENLIGANIKDISVLQRMLEPLFNENLPYIPELKPGILDKLEGKKDD